MPSAIKNVSSTEMPAVRSRARAMTLDAPINTKLVNDPELLKKQLRAKFTPLISAVAIANAKKNEGTSEEKKAKDKLNEQMILEEQTNLEALVTMGKNEVAYSAIIAETVDDVVNPSKVFDLICGERTATKLKTLGGEDFAKFLSLVGITKGNLEEALGKNATILCSDKVTKPASLSVKKVK